MGAAASSINNDDLPENIHELLEMCEKQKYAIAEYDNAVFDREMEKVFKKHGRIITTITSRTKTQLRKTQHLKKSSPDEVFKLLGGNHYAKFIKSLYMSKQELEMESIKNSSKSDYDEELLIQILGTSNMKELTLFIEMYSIEKKQTLLETFEIHAKKNISLCKLIKLLLTTKRDESRSVDQELASSQAEEIHKAGAARLKGVDEDIIFQILLGNSRAQMTAVADIYLTKFHMKFERAINMKFKGSCARLILLLTMTLPAAVSSCIHTLEDRFLIDKVAIFTMLAKYDKEFLQQVDLCSEKLYSKNLLSLAAGRGFSGNLYNAIQGWIENPSPDKGYERILEMFLEGKLLNGYDLRELIDEEDFQSRILFLLTKQNEEIIKYMKEHSIRFNINDNFQLNLLESFDSMKHKAVEDAQKILIEKYSKKKSLKDNDEKYDLKQKKVMEYLKKYFQNNDPNTTGIFEEDYFWDLMLLLPMDELGLTREEIISMKDWTEWSVDGQIQYFEVLFELCDTIINSIESKTNDKNNDVIIIIEELMNNPSMLRLIKTERRMSNSMNLFNAVPEYFLQLLYDTFEAFDFDNNKYLCGPELTSIISVLNIEELTLEHFLKDEADSITHKAAVEVVSKTVNAWFLSRTEDHYICLIDKDTGLYFWYNTKDESSQWADTGDYGEGYDYNVLEYNPSTRPAANFSSKGESNKEDGHNLAEDAKRALNAVDEDEEGIEEKKVTEKVVATDADDTKEDFKGNDEKDVVVEDDAKDIDADRSEDKESSPVNDAKDETSSSSEAKEDVSSTEAKGEEHTSCKEEVPDPPPAENLDENNAEPKASPRAPDDDDVGTNEIAADVDNRGEKYDNDCTDDVGKTADVTEEIKESNSTKEE